MRASSRRSRERAGSSVVAEWGWLQAVWSSRSLPRRSREKVAKLSNLAVTFCDDAIFLRRLRIRWQNLIFAYPRQFSCYWHGERSIYNVPLFWTQKCLFTYCYSRQPDKWFRNSSWGSFTFSLKVWPVINKRLIRNVSLTED